MVFLILQLMSTIRFITQLMNYKLCETNFEERYVARRVVHHYSNLTYKTTL
jgi:hypothetical protein